MIDQEKNQILKKMWTLSEQEILSEEEKNFYNQNLSLIQNYYQENSLLWSNKKQINS